MAFAIFILFLHPARRFLRNLCSQDSTLYVTTSPCIECAKLIIQAGIKRVVYSENYRCTDGVDLLRQAGINVEWIELPNTNE